MDAREIVRDIYRLGMYTPEQFVEYVGHFRKCDGLLGYITQPTTTSNEIEQRIQARRGATPVDPNYGLSERVTSVDLLRESQRDGATLGIVSGCFDLLHLGHVRGMTYAKQFLSHYNHPLLVALTLSDAHVRAKKGESRPVLNINERLDMICRVACVDYVIPLEEPNCLTVLRELQPEYFFKTNADRSQEIVRREIEVVESQSGSVITFPPRPDTSSDTGVKSTTRMIESVLEKIMREW
ncbi:hypothetical protein HY605_02195 [Candidatus Peregrinibacteria bacterium]|nr:hypothetical protein [Candidatus Peregrinibacteria bacterium]